MRAHVTEELIKVVKVQHKKHPAMTQKELAERIGCSAATVGRILAGKYNEDSDKMYTYGELDPKTGKVKTAKDTGNEQNFIIDNVVYDNGRVRFLPGEPQKPDMDEAVEKSNIPKEMKMSAKKILNEAYNSPLLDYSKIMDYLNYLNKKIEVYGRPNPNPMSEERFRQLVATEIITLRQTQVDMYKELKQLKGILAEIRDIWKK